MQGFQVINGEHVGTILVSDDNQTLTVLKSNQLLKGLKFGTDYLAMNQFKTIPITGSDLSLILNEGEVENTMLEPERFPMLTLKLG